jgi:glycosyltransferase involved in cell wall biosynthesis
MKDINILCPVYNESENIRLFISEFDKIISGYADKYKFTFYFADNCSTDDTLSILKEVAQSRNDVRVISYAKNYGVMKSIYTGILNSKCDALAVFDCDLQDPPELLAKYIALWESGYSFVYGVRVSRQEVYLLTWFRKMYKKIERFVNPNPVHVESGAWFLDNEIIEVMRKNNNFDSYLPGLLSRVAYNSVGVPYDRVDRKFGTSKFNFFAYFSYARDGLLSGTITPLRISVFVGMGLFFLSMLSSFYFILAKFYLGIQFSNGIAALLILTLTLFSFNFLILGIFGEYLGRIYLARNNQDPAVILFDSDKYKKEN